MPRQPRFNLPGQSQHVIVRGNNRSDVFHRRYDRLFFLEKLQDAVAKHECEVHAYVLMTNHVHLLITPHSESALSKVMQSVGRSYVQFFNKRYQRTGTLWEGRYKAALIDSETYALTCYRYIELNPVRAKMVAHPSEYPWSSYHYNALGKENALLTPHCLYQRLGANRIEQQASYRDLFNGHLNEQTLNDIRDSTNKCWVLGKDQYKTDISGSVNRPVAPLKRGGDRRSRNFNRV